MAERRAAARRTTAYRTTDSRSMYIYGNTVTKPEYVPERREETRDPERKRRKSRQVRQNQRKALRINKGYVVFLTVAAVLALFICVNYVRLQSQITGHSRNITSMQEELASMREENNTRYNSIMDGVNLEDVQEKAVGDLGMVPADKSQIVEYSTTDSDYVTQYEDIPKDGILASSKKVQD